MMLQDTKRGNYQKDKQYNGQMTQGKKINNDLQNITQKTKD